MQRILDLRRIYALTVDPRALHGSVWKVDFKVVRQELIRYIKDLALFEGEFILSSGQKSSYYIDLRRVSLDCRAAPIIGKVMFDLICDLQDVDAIGGLTMGADPIACAIMHYAASVGRSYNAFVVRKQKKTHGLARLIEGPDIRGKRVVIVEDTSTTGNSPITAARRAEETGATVAAIAVMVDRETGARQAIEKAGYSYYAALRVTDLLDRGTAD
ncbi:orotate phosphoribosyltransferase [Tropheryma whipplei]|uniref:orotate phosphoribosyltransferase n=1 Tax=Tropheryma whipplei TaxID=2039 RepID=UPI0009B7105D|nr:orotate phosphoribosyltransferase [Tropheryma whipplei]